MKQSMIRRLAKPAAALLCCIFLCLIFMPAERTSAVSASAYLTMEAATGQIISSYQAEKCLPMASTTKIMTALLTLEAGDLDRYFTVNTAAIKVEGSSMGLQEGDQVTLRILAQGMLLASGNDAANAAAVRISGTIPDFVALMNTRAQQLGMKNTHFVTPSGLDDEAHYSTAYDMALLARAALQNPDFAAICSQTTMKLSYGNPPYDRWLSNHNRLLKQYDGCIGVKTGFTKKSGRCLVSAATRDGVTVLCVTLHAPDDWNDHEQLLDAAFSQVSVQTLPTDALQGITVPVVGGDCNEVSPILLSEPTAPMVGGETQALETELILPRFLYAPVRAGDLIGELRYYRTVDGERILLASAELVAQESAEAVNGYIKGTFWKRLLGWLHARF